MQKEAGEYVFLDLLLSAFAPANLVFVVLVFPPQPGVRYSGSLHVDLFQDRIPVSYQCTASK